METRKSHANALWHFKCLPCLLCLSFIKLEVERVSKASKQIDPSLYIVGLLLVPPSSPLPPLPVIVTIYIYIYIYMCSTSAQLVESYDSKDGFYQAPVEPKVSSVITYIILPNIANLILLVLSRKFL